MVADEIYMHRCLQIAKFACGNTSPNPMVGSVIVRDGEIISEGYHHKAGEPHAERNAINSLPTDCDLSSCTLYVNLEPCSHYGKTPPCAEIIIAKRIKRVVVGMLDPNPLVAGRGINMLRNAGIEVEIGILNKECLELNKRFICYHVNHRPYVILKWAQTQDGFLDRKRTERGDGPLRISNEITKTLNHQVRTQEDAILVGVKTALLDDPHLTSRKWGGKNPIRCVIDLNARLEKDMKLFNSAAKTIIFRSPKYKIDTAALPENIEVVYVDTTDNVPSRVLEFLYSKNVQSIIVEGGAVTIQSFIDANLWDEARIEVSKERIQSGVKVPILSEAPARTDYCYDNLQMLIINSK